METFLLQLNFNMFLFKVKFSFNCDIYGLHSSVK